MFARVPAQGADSRLFAKARTSTPADLKELETYSVETEGNIKIRDKIIAIISKALPALKLVDDDADVRLYYTGGSREVAGATQAYGNTIINSSDLAYGSGIVCVDPIGPDKTKLRLVVQFSNQRDNEGEASPPHQIRQRVR
ncbi:MAG: hypothetical protein IPG67_15035 [Acidobacteria bacterium]|nr:hypothetical protein [Acidobacteriota bacterium]